MSGKLIAITGCDSGIGKSIAKELSEKGYTLAITYLNKNPFPKGKNIICYKMDLRSEKDIKSFADEVKKLCKEKYELFSLINNAGVAFGGPIENIPLKNYREIFEVNFFGLISLTQKLIPEIIKSKGKIVIVGSMAGRIALPFLSPYVSTKFALEGFTDSLRRELLPFGIKTILIEPGGIATPIWGKAKKQDISFVDEKYIKSMKEFEKNFIDTSANAMNVDKCASQITKIILKKKPKKRYIISDNNFFTTLPIYLPADIIDKFFIKLFKMDYK